MTWLYIINMVYGSLTPGNEMVQPIPLEASHPRAKEAAAVVDLILKGEREAVLTLLRDKGTRTRHAGVVMEISATLRVCC